MVIVVIKSGSGDNAPRAGEAMGGLAKGLRILEGFDVRRPKMTITEAAEYAGLSPASARRCLLTLVDVGYVVQAGRYFEPTPRMVRLGRTYSSTSPLTLYGQRYLDEARDELNESVSLAVWDEGQCLFVARADASQIVSTGIAVGVRLPAHASATGRALLAAMKDDEIVAFLRSYPPTKMTPSTITDVNSLLTIIRRARELGYAESSEELELGMHSVALPVVDSRGSCVASISVSAFTGRVGLDALLKDALPVLKRAAGEIGKIL